MIVKAQVRAPTASSFGVGLSKTNLKEGDSQNGITP